jgi:hypothetical protein
MRLFTIISFAKKYKSEWAIPEWDLAKYFDYPIPQKKVDNLIQYREPHFHYTPEIWDKVNWNKTIDLYGWFQSWKYWDKEEIKKVLKFKEEFLKTTDFPLSSMVAVSVRRGDFVGNKNYYQLPIEYYLGALEHFPNREVLVFSDDIEWCKKNFIGRYHFSSGSPIEQLALMVQCSDYVISNSTFSYCGAYLSENQNAKVIRPKYNLAGNLASRKSEVDFWPSEWIIYDYENTKAAVLVYHKNIFSLYPKEWIEKFKQSIRNQTHKDFDILELNYGGGQERIFEESKFESIAMPTFPHAMNYLFEKAKDYDVVFNTNCDDYYSENRFEVQIREIKKGFDVVSSNFSLVKNDKITHTHQFHLRDIKKELTRDHNVICHPVLAYSKRFVQNEKYSPDLIPFEDMKLWQQTIHKYKYIILPEVLCFHRLHNNSVGHNLKEV